MNPVRIVSAVDTGRDQSYTVTGLRIPFETSLEDILDPWEDPTCCGPHLLPAEPALDFPDETFRVLKNKETNSSVNTVPAVSFWKPGNDCTHRV
jgi:hypothetical protein